MAVLLLCFVHYHIHQRNDQIDIRQGLRLVQPSLHRIGIPKSRQEWRKYLMKRKGCQGQQCIGALYNQGMFADTIQRFKRDSAKGFPGPPGDMPFVGRVL